MKNAIFPSSHKTWFATAAMGAALLLNIGQAQSQTVYRVVGPDGKVSFSDKPPLTASNVTTLGSGGKSAGTDAPGLPFELRQVVSKYPVTLYTSTDCAPCESGRTLLSGRGVPFTEKTVTTPDDAQALRRISGESSLPFLTIGGQQIKGYSDSEWTQFLNAAGYPAASILPAKYRRPAATPLVVVQKPVPAAKVDEARPVSAQPRPTPVDTSSNPAGIKF